MYHFLILYLNPSKPFSVDPRVLYETPVRIFGCIADTPLAFSDYMFQDETASDSLDRFRDLINFELSEDDLDMNVEHLPSMFCII